MKTVAIQNICMENFKGQRALTLTFGSKNVSIYGDNAAGKTTVYDALCWLLYGRDSLGRGEKLLELKPLNDEGQVSDRNAVTMVEATLCIDAAPITLRRTLREQWALKRGAKEASFDGNVCDYAVDGVPLKKSEYDRRIAEKIGEETVFRMLTDVYYFAGGMDWRERRSVLLGLAGISADSELMRLRADFAPLREALGKQSIEQLRSKLNAQKKALTGVRDEVPAKLTALEQVRAELAQTDFAAAQRERDGFAAEQKRCLSLLTAAPEDSAEKERAKLRFALAELNAEERAAKSAEALQEAVAELTQKREQCVEGLAQAQQEQEQLRKKRVGARVCRLCGQPLPPEMAKAQFSVEKEEGLQRLAQTSEKYRAALTDTEQKLKKIAAQQEKAAQRTEKRRQIEQQLADLETAHTVQTAQKREERLSLQRALQAAETAVAACDAQLGKRETLEGVCRKMDALRADAVRTEQALNEVEQLRFLLEEFLRFKVGFVEDGINRLFRTARFRLFRPQANGGMEERCDVLCGGVPYGGLNSGAKIHIGMDICSALAKHYGLCVPLFLDNAESVTRLPDWSGQRIRLVVSAQDAALRCETEESA